MSEIWVTHGLWKRFLFSCFFILVLLSIKEPLIARDNDESPPPFVPPVYGYKRITDFSGPHSDTDPCVSPDGNMIAFLRNVPTERGCFICVVSADGSDVREIASIQTGQVLGLCWLPDGAHLALGLSRDTKDGHLTDIQQISITGDGEPFPYQNRKVAPQGKHPAISRDGKLAYVYRNNIVVELNGEEQIYLTMSGFQSHPNWSHNGTWLIYHSSPGLALQDSFQEDATVLRMKMIKDGEGHGWCSMPRFCPDSEKILCIGLIDQKYDLWVFPQVDGVPYRVTDDEFMEAGADWLPDGRIVFSSNKAGEFALWMAVEGLVEEAATQGDDMSIQEGEDPDTGRPLQESILSEKDPVDHEDR